MKTLVSLSEARRIVEVPRSVFENLVACGHIRVIRVKGVDRNYYGTQNLLAVRDKLAGGGGTTTTNETHHD